MKRPFEILGEIVDELREMAEAGQPVAALIDHVWSYCPAVFELQAYLGAAFWTDGGHPRLLMLPKEASGKPVASMAERMIQRTVDANRDTWSAAGPFPDLMRRRDRDAFRAVARRTDTIIVVRAEPRAAGQYIGREGFEPAPADLVAVPRTRGPNEGLMAGDPEDPRLARLLETQQPAMDYAQYHRYLEASGFTVMSVNEGHVVRDVRGTLFHPTYRVHGVYAAVSGADAWSEVIRADLNRTLGAELVIWGPYDSSEDRRRLDAVVGRFEAPAPVIAFLPDGQALTRLDAESVTDFYRANLIDWDAYYDQAPESGAPSRAD